MNPKYTYTPTHHFKKVLKQYEGKTQVPIELVHQVTTYLTEKQITNPNSSDIYRALRKLNKQNHYDDAYTILSHINKDKKLVQVSIEIECPICFDEVDSPIELRCKHRFCKACIDQIKAKDTLKCPLCRRVQDIFEQHQLTPEQRDLIMRDFEVMQASFYDPRRRVYTVSFDTMLQQIIDQNHF